MLGPFFGCHPLPNKCNGSNWYLHEWKKLQWEWEDQSRGLLPCLRNLFLSKYLYFKLQEAATLQYYSGMWCLGLEPDVTTFVAKFHYISSVVLEELLNRITGISVFKNVHSGSWYNQHKGLNELDLFKKTLKILKYFFQRIVWVFHVICNVQHLSF